MYLSTEELIALAMEQNNLAMEYVEEKKHKSNTLLVVLSILAIILVLAWTSLARADGRHTSLYMDVTVKSVVGVVSIDGSPSGDATYNITFVNNVGDEFFFTNVTKPFKVGDRTTLEFVVDFSGETFKVIDAFYVVQDTRFSYPENKPDEWKMFVGLGGIMLAMLFGGYLIGIKIRPRGREVITR
jgi:hypothetical protein